MTTIRSVRGRPGGPSKMPPLKPKPEQPVYQPSQQKSAKNAASTKTNSLVNQSQRQTRPTKQITVQPKGAGKAKPKQEEDIWAQCEREYKATCEEFGYDFGDDSKVDWLNEADSLDDALLNNFYQEHLNESSIALLVDDACKSIELTDDPIENQKRMNDAVISKLLEAAAKTREIAERRTQLLSQFSDVIMSHPATTEYTADTVPDPDDSPKRPKSEPKGRMEPRARNLRK